MRVVGVQGHEPVNDASTPPGKDSNHLGAEAIKRAYDDHRAALVAIGNFATAASALGVALLAPSLTIALASTGARQMWTLWGAVFFLAVSLYCGSIARGQHIKILLASRLTSEGITKNRRLGLSSRIQMWTILPAVAFLIVYAVSNVELRAPQGHPREGTTTHPTSDHRDRPAQPTDLNESPSTKSN